MKKSTETTESIRQVVFPAPGRVELIDVPRPMVEPDELLVRPAFTAVSAGTELTVLHQKFAPGTHWDRWVKFPFCPGYSGAGVVVAVGEDVEGWSIGDSVAGRVKHAEMSCVLASTARRVPESVDARDAAWVGLLKIVQIGARAGEHRLGDRAVVVGCGILGQILLQYLAVTGCRTIIAVDTDRARLDLAAAHGATHTICGAIAETMNAIFDACGGGQPDVVYDVTGSRHVLPDCLRLARDFGKVIILGDTGYPDHQTITADIIRRGVQLCGAHDIHPPQCGDRNMRWGSKEIEDYALELIAQKRVTFDHLTTHVFAPTDAVAAYQLAADPDQPNLGLLFQW